MNGTENVFIGAQAGYNNASGQNVFVGYHAGEWNVGGQMNTYLGHEAGGNLNLVNATAIGASAKVTADNSLVLGRKANVGIGVSAPSFQLHLSTANAAKAGSPDWIVASDSRLKRILPISPMDSICSNKSNPSGSNTTARQALKQARSGS